MDLRELECFVAVATRLHFRRAAEDLHLSPATVSDAVTRLERGLGGKLFDRSTRQVALTSFGDEFLPMAEAAVRKVHATFDRARARASDGSTPFKVGHRGNLGIHLQVACAQIQRVCGDVHVELQEQSTSWQLESLRRG